MTPPSLSAAGPPRPSQPRRAGPDSGTVTVFIADEQADSPGAAPVDDAMWCQLAEQVLGTLGVRGEAELSVLYVDEAHMTELNTQFMGGDGPTDVLSFPLDGESRATGRWPDGGTTGPEAPPTEFGDLPLLLGDVVICPAVAARNAPEHCGTYDDEMALLLVHAILHLLGHDHAEPDQRDRMWAAERALLDTHWRPMARDPWTP